MSEFKKVTLQDIIDAKSTVYKFLQPTPLYFNKQISDETGAEVYIKFENHQPVGAFKVRGGLVRLSKLSDKQKRTGVAAASTGNHGQSVAFAAKAFGANAKIYVPEGNNPDKNQAITNLGAEVIEAGKDFDEARMACDEDCKKKGYMLVHSCNEPDLLAGVGTMGLEMFETLPDVDVLINPIGLGSGICGNSIALKSQNPKIKVFGVQAENAPSLYLSYKNGKLQSTESANTFAEGLATRMPFEYTFNIMQNMVDDIFVVSEEEMEKAIIKLFDTTHNIAEGAGAASTAALYNIADKVKGKKVVLLLSGGNLTREKLSSILTKWNHSR